MNNMENPIITDKTINQETGEIQIITYIKKKYLGKLGTTDCYEFICNNTGKLSTAKIFDKNELKKLSIKQRFNSELNIHRSLQHTGILAYEHSFEDADNIYILLETYDKTLLDFLSLNKNLSEIETKKIVLQIIDALKYLQANNVINRNINLSTLVISNKLEVKIGDFSFAAKIENNIREKSIYGSNVLLAPEVLNPEVGQSFEVDIWYLGFLMYTLLVGENPFQNEDINKSYKLIKEGNLNFPKEYLISDSAKNLIVKMLSHDPYKRPTLDMLLSDKLFNNTDFP